jgi:hypothetical protein
MMGIQYQLAAALGTPSSGPALEGHSLCVWFLAMGVAMLIIGLVLLLSAPEGDPIVSDVRSR